MKTQVYQVMLVEITFCWNCVSGYYVPQRKRTKCTLLFLVEDRYTKISGERNNLKTVAG